jgi:hypothetical protein
VNLLKIKILKLKVEKKTEVNVVQNANKILNSFCAKQKQKETFQLMRENHEVQHLLI